MQAILEDVAGICGLPAVNYSLDELGYYVYNPRPSKLYGLSRVEQVMVTIRIALERAMSQLAYYTEGTIPDAIMELPENYTFEQIQQYSEWFNSIMSGQTDMRRKAHFGPKGLNYKETKTEILKDTFDEWLARIVCYSFSLSPQAFVKEMNRATSETAKQAAQEEGLEPTKLWFKDLMDDALVRMGHPELEWGWEDEEIVDPESKAKVIQTYYGGSTGAAKPIITLAEARELAGFSPASPQQLEELQPPAPEPAPATNAAGGDGGANRLGKLAWTDFSKRKAGTSSGGRSLPPLQRNERHRRQDGPQRIRFTGQRARRQR